VSCTVALALRIAMLAMSMLAPASSAALADQAEQTDAWPGLARDIFKGRPLADGAGFLKIEMPGRAEDAAIVPLTVRATLAATETRRVRSFTIVIDENPAPLAATFHMGPGAIVAAISTRVRVNSYTNVHAVAELSDGKLYAVTTYVKASGGCSAPASKDPEKSGIGDMRFRQFTQAAEAGASNMREAQVMIRHPNNSGLQMDQSTRLYVPAFFVQSLKIWQGEELLLAMEGSISISEDPNLRFTYRPNGAKTMRAEAIDTKDHLFEGKWPVTTSRVEIPESDD
jgi:sulfur-oxidizing protein SoxY